MAKKGERGKGKREREKKGRGQLVGSPASSLWDYNEERPMGSCNLRLHELPLLSAQTCAERIRENKRRRPGMGIVVSNFVLLYALYGGMPYITHGGESIGFTENQDSVLIRIWRHFQDTCSWLNLIKRTDFRTNLKGIDNTW